MQNADPNKKEELRNLFIKLQIILKSCEKDTLVKPVCPVLKRFFYRGIVNSGSPPPM